MRILQVAPLVSPIDERREPIGGAQAMVADIARGLARRGHTVSLAAADGSFVTGVSTVGLGIDHRSLVPADLGERTGSRPDDAAQRDAFGRVRRWLDAHPAEIDVVHAHAYDAPAFDALRGAPRPVMHTLHLAPRDAEVVRAAREARDAALVTVSKANARAWRDAGVTVRDVVYNGVDVDAIAIGPHRGDHLLYAGRLSPEKGVEVALDVADLVGRGLLLVGGAYDATYHARAVAPRVVTTRDIAGPIRGAIYIGPRRREEVWSLMGGAAATLMPVRWDEPFGLVAVESLAAGTPVVAFARGALPEILTRDVGALVEPDDVDAFARAVEATVGREPAVCRARASEFDLGAMVTRYEELYASLTATPAR